MNSQQYERDPTELANEIDLYKLIGVLPNASALDINNAYKQCISKCHPDKVEENKKDQYKKLFQAINTAYAVLSDEASRKEYDSMRGVMNQATTDYYSLKKSHGDYQKTIGEYRPATDQEKLTFSQKNAELDLKRGINRSDEGIISKEEAKKKYSDLQAERSRMDAEIKHQKLFEGKMDNKKFNAMFDKLHSKNNNTDLITSLGQPQAFNNGGSGFSTLDNDEPFQEAGDITSSIYGTSHFGNNKSVDLDPSDLDDLDGADYYTNHNKKDDNYKSQLKDRIKQRESFTTQFNDMKFTDYNTKTDENGIFDKVGIDMSSRLTFNDDLNISKRFETEKEKRIQDKRLQDRNNALNPERNNSLNDELF